MEMDMGDANGAHASTSALHLTEPSPGKARGGVTQDEYGKIWMDGEQQDEVLIFPEGEQDAVTITSYDMEGLQPGGLINGNIIDFYIKYMQSRLCSINNDCLHFFNTYFFTKLLEIGGLPKEQRDAAYKEVQKWAGEVNIFEKKFVFIPVHQSSHWSLIIICHLSSLTNSPDKQECLPCILHLDSVEGKHKNLEDHILGYISHAMLDTHQKLKVDQLVALRQMKYEELKVPQQENHYDCGIYLLRFIEHFLRESLNVDFVPNQENFFTSLGVASEVSAKRRDIFDLILELSLAFRRKSREHQTGLLQLYQRRPVSQISDVLETHLDGNVNVSEGRIEDLQMHDTKQLNAEVNETEYPDHEEPGEVALDSQRHIETERFGLLSTDENMLDDQLECAPLKAGKERRKRCRNWTKDETSILLTCMKEGGRFCKGVDQATTNWSAVSQEIAHRLPGTLLTASECRRRYDTLLKAYKTSKVYCTKMGKPFSELRQGEVKSATHLTEDWYSAIEILQHLTHKARSTKRVKLDIPSGEDSGGGQAALVKTHLRERLDGWRRCSGRTFPEMTVSEMSFEALMAHASARDAGGDAGGGTRAVFRKGSGGDSVGDSGGYLLKTLPQNEKVKKDLLYGTPDGLRWLSWRHLRRWFAGGDIGGDAGEDAGGDAGGDPGGDAGGDPGGDSGGGSRTDFGKGSGGDSGGGSGEISEAGIGGGSEWMLSNLPYGLLKCPLTTLSSRPLHAMHPILVV